MYVSDTHPLFYQAFGKPTRLGRNARKLFESADVGRSLIYVPTAVLWEIAKIVDWAVKPVRRFDHWCRTLEAHRGYAIAPLEWTDVDEARRLPFSDPLDCLIVGTAIRLGLPLITKDRLIEESGLVETVWQ